MNSDSLNVYALFSGFISNHFTVRRRTFEELLTVQLHVNSVYDINRACIPCYRVIVFVFLVLLQLTEHRTRNILNNTIFILMLFKYPIHPAIHPLMCFINGDTFFNSFNNFIQLYPPDWFESPFIHSETSINLWGYEVYIRWPFYRLKSNLCIFINRLQI